MNTNPVSIDNLPSIASAAMLGSLNISVWEGRKKDKASEQELQESKGARSSRATSVHKHLFAECPALEAIKTLRGEARQWFNRQTLPWDDNANRIITSKQYFEMMQDAANYQTRFNDLVGKFFNVYTLEISKQAFELGAFFNRDEYPTLDELRGKFKFDVDVKPLPMAGDFRVDIGNEALRELQMRCEKDVQDKLARAMSDAWGRVRDTVTHIQERMTAVIEHDPDAVEEIKHTVRVAVGSEVVPVYDDNGNQVGTETREVFADKESLEIKKKRRPKLHDSMLDHGMELCALLRDLNITNDPALEEARRDLERALVHVDMGSLKKVPEMQQSLKTAMDNIVSKFAF